MTLRKLIQRIEGHDIISFDIFDTLVYRSCISPQAVFAMTGEKMGEEPMRYKELRINAEEKARHSNGKSEITLDEIYANMSNLSEKQKTEFKKCEELIELSVCRMNPEMTAVYQYCREKNKIIILTSDIYLEERLIKQILKKCHITGYTKLFLSSRHKKTKSNGLLFDVVKATYCCNGEKVLHIGDNYKSDYVMPRMKGLDAFFYRYKNSRLDLKKDLLGVAAFTSSRCQNTDDVYYQFGYQVFGPFLYGFVNWLDKQLSFQHQSRIFFFSREGQFLKRAFDSLFFGKYQESYLYVSRRSLAIPAVVMANTLEDFLALRPMYPRVTVENAIGKLGLSKEDFKECPWYDNAVLNKTFGELSDLQKVAIQKDMFDKTKQNAYQEAENLRLYLKQEQVKGRFAVVDLGWNGSMQRALAQVFQYYGIDADMTGFFLAQRDEYYKNAKYIENYGYLFNYGRVSSNENFLLNSGTSLLELLFMADHGSAVSYENLSGQVKAVLDCYEFEDIYPKVKICQDAAIDFIRDYSGSHSYQHCYYKEYFYPMYRILKQPPRKIMEAFGDFRISDMNEKDMFLAKKLSNRKNCIKEFRDAGWKVAFLKRNFNLPSAFFVYKRLRQLFS